MPAVQAEDGSAEPAEVKLLYLAVTDKRHIEYAIANVLLALRKRSRGHERHITFVTTELLVLIGRLAMIVDSCAIWLLGVEIRAHEI